MSPSTPRPPRQSLAALLHAPGAEPDVQAVAAPPDAALPQSATVAEPLPAAAVSAGALPDTAPAFARRPTGARALPRWQWIVLALLALTLLLQVVLADRARLAADAGSRPLVESLCGLLGCSLPAWQEPDAFSMLERSVLPVPGHPGVLSVEASFRNDARWSQSLPLIELTLSTADGQVSGQRIFTPAEYLGSAPPVRVAPGQSVQAHLLLAEPPASAEAFHFRFR